MIDKTPTDLVQIDKKKFIGFISKTKLFNKCREILASQVDLYEDA